MFKLFGVSVRFISFVSISISLLLIFLAVNAYAENIKIGLLVDKTGPTSLMGKKYSKGIHSVIEYLNRIDYLPGKKFELLEGDTKYDPEIAARLYKDFVNQGIVGLQAWGTPSIVPLINEVTRDQVITFSASYESRLADPKVAPYNFIIAADYTTQFRAAMKFFAARMKNRPIKLGLIYPDNTYGKSPVFNGIPYVKTIGYQVVANEMVSTYVRRDDPTQQILNLQKSSPDLIWIGSTMNTTAFLLELIQRYGVNGTIINNIWGADEELLTLAGDGADNTYSLQCCLILQKGAKGMEQLTEAFGPTIENAAFTRGMAAMLVMAKGIKRASQHSDISGANIKTALETIRNYSPMGLTPPISYYPDDHRPNMSVFIYKFENKSLVLQGIEKLPRNKRWLGK